MHFSPLLVLPAYLDPGSGSLIIQMLIAVIIGAGFLLRTFWGKITGKSKRNEDEDEDEPSEEEDRRS